jgi:hypothetical protein
MNRQFILLMGIALPIALSVAGAAGPRAMVMEARDLAYDANFRNDQTGLRSAIATLQPLTNEPDIGAYANYYVSWSYWALAASQFQEKNVSGALESGQSAVEHARRGLRVRENDPEFHTALVNALIVVAVLDPSQFQKAAAEIAPARRKALELGAANPRVVLMDAGMIFNNPPEHGGGLEKGLARWHEALRLFELEANAKAVDPIAPRWGHALAYGWLPDMYLRMTPPDRDKARTAADHALQMRPDFWYVREQVMPRLRE